MSSVEQINSAAKQITLGISIICIIFGTIGLLLNLIIFTRRSFQANSCCIYFLAATCINLFVVFIIVPFRILVGVFNIDPTSNNEPLCKIQIYLFSVTRALAIWFIALACMDRYFCSSSNIKLRTLNSVKFARRIICTCTALLIIVYIHNLIYFKIGLVSDQLGHLVPSCIPTRGIYAIFTPFWNLVWYALLPSFLMFIFGILTINNIRRSHHRVISQNQLSQNRINNQLLKMLLIQVITILLTIIPFIACRLQLSLTLNNIKSQYEIARDNLFLQTATVISLISHSISFYLFTLTGPIFRQELIRIIAIWLPLLIPKNKGQHHACMITNVQNRRIHPIQ
ncbi:unnamed protein product [Adineta steineri]|uniref:G-protein coupled receptors family 1 profile domain-containing protein n=1 Tax=Adineta steineri TaxID=433720 RepID=A0A815ALE7_9BILA|nr:unnamed protein product [Adineta steineri]CAF1547209.1 unnamed protein product [Adineta steineri]